MALNNYNGPQMNMFDHQVNKNLTARHQKLGNQRSQIGKTAMDNLKNGLGKSASFYTGGAIT